MYSHEHNQRRFRASLGDMGGQESRATGDACDRALGRTAIRLSLKFQLCDFHRTRIIPQNCAVESDIFILQQFASSRSQGRTNLKTQYKA